MLVSTPPFVEKKVYCYVQLWKLPAEENCCTGTTNNSWSCATRHLRYRDNMQCVRHLLCTLTYLYTITVSKSNRRSQVRATRRNLVGPYNIVYYLYTWLHLWLDYSHSGCITYSLKETTGSGLLRWQRVNKMKARVGATVISDQRVAADGGGGEHTHSYNKRNKNTPVS